MRTLKGLALVMDLADRQRLQAGKCLAQSQRVYGFTQSQLQQLESYQEDSQARWVMEGRQVVGGELLQGRYRFMDRLGLAINLQEGVLKEVQQQLETAKKKSVAAEFRLVSLQRVMAKRSELQAQELARKAQKQTDEFASQRYASSAVRHQEGG
jgi:flagellar FliJ protein